jgi:hypothetical protein
LAEPNQIAVSEINKNQTGISKLIAGFRCPSVQHHHEHQGQGET